MQDQSGTKSFKFTSMNSLPCGCHVDKPTAAAKPFGKFYIGARYKHRIEIIQKPDFLVCPMILA